MKHLALFTLLAIFFACSPPQTEPEEKFEVLRGTNIAHWLSQSNRRGLEREQFFTRTDVEAIETMGFDHVRLPIDEEQMWDENEKREWILEKWQKPILKAEKLGLPLYCGEFGIIAGPPEESLLNWYRDMIQLFEKKGIGYANWNYKSGSFGLVNGEGSRNEDLIQIVSGN